MHFRRTLDSLSSGGLRKLGECQLTQIGLADTCQYCQVGHQGLVVGKQTPSGRVEQWQFSAAVGCSFQQMYSAKQQRDVGISSGLWDGSGCHGLSGCAWSIVLHDRTSTCSSVSRCTAAQANVANGKPSKRYIGRSKG